MKVLHTPHIARGHSSLAMQSALVHTQKLAAARLLRVQLWAGGGGGGLRESTCSRKWKPNKNAIETKTVYFIGCAASLATHTAPPLPHPKQVGRNVISFSPSFQQANEANSAKQKPCKIMSMASLSCSFSCRHYRQLFPRSRQTETAQQIVTGRVREREYSPLSYNESWCVRCLSKPKLNTKISSKID